MSDQQRPPRGSDLPLWFRVGTLGVLVVTFVTHLAVDVAAKDYDGGSQSLLLGGIIGTALGVGEFMRRDR